jgi:hypothetical protein
VFYTCSKSPCFGPVVQQSSPSNQKLQNTTFAGPTSSYFTFYKNITPTKPAYFLTLYYHISFQDPNVSGNTVISTSQIRRAEMLFLPTAGNHWGALQWYNILNKVL